MTTSLHTNSHSDIRKFFAGDYSLPFKLLIVLLIFNSFRPDRLLAGGAILLYFPTVILVILLLLWAKAPRKKIFNAQTKIFLAFLVVMGFGALFARNKSWAFLQLRNFFIYSFILYMVTVQFIDTGFKVEKYICWFIILSLFMSFLGIIHKGVLPVSVLSDENDFSLFMNILIPIGFFLGQEARERRNKVLYYSTTIVSIGATISSFSRGGFVGLIFVGLFIFLKKKRNIATLLLVAILASIILTFAPAGYWEEMQTIQSEGMEEGTGRERVESWKAGWKMFLDHPIFGVGPQNFGIWLPEYYVQYGPKEPGRMWGRAAHSLYITILSETGLAGTLLFTLMLWKNYKNHQYIESLEKRKGKLLKQTNLSREESHLASLGIRKLYFISLGYSGAMIGFLCTAAFLSVLYYGYFWMLTSFWVMTSNAAINIERMLRERRRSGGVNTEVQPISLKKI